MFFIMVMQMIHMYDIKTVFILRIIKVGATAPLSVERKTNTIFVEIEKKIMMYIRQRGGNIK